MNINSVHEIPEGCSIFAATPLWYAYTRGRNEKLFTYLLKSGANPDNCMFAIAWYDDVTSAALFKKHGAKIDDVVGGNTPFLAAFQWKKFNVAEWFLQNGANINFADSEGNTALFYAIKRKYKMEYIKLLLKFGVDFNKENKDGISAKKISRIKWSKKNIKSFCELIKYVELRRATKLKKTSFYTTFIPGASYKISGHLKNQVIISKANKIAVTNNKPIPAMKMISAIFSNR